MTANQSIQLDRKTGNHAPSRIQKTTLIAPFDSHGSLVFSGTIILSPQSKWAAVLLASGIYFMSFYL